MIRGEKPSKDGTVESHETEAVSINENVRASMSNPDGRLEINNERLRHAEKTKIDRLNKESNGRSDERKEKNVILKTSF